MTSTIWTKRSSAALAAALLLLLAGPAFGSPEGEARAAIDATLDEVLPLLRSTQLTKDEKISQLSEIAERRFDLKGMTALVLGRNRKKLSPEQREEFLAEFKRHITVTYADGLDSVSTETVEITGTRLERNGHVTVKSRIVGGSADGVLLDYRMRNNKKDRWRVLDISIEGVSVAQSFRAQVQEIISAQGVDQLISILRKKNDKAAAAASAQ